MSTENIQRKINDNPVRSRHKQNYQNGMNTNKQHGMRERVKVTRHRRSELTTQSSRQSKIFSERSTTTRSTHNINKVIKRGCTQTNNTAWEIDKSHDTSQTRTRYIIITSTAKIFSERLMITQSAHGINKFTKDHDHKQSTRHEKSSKSHGTAQIRT